MNEDRSALVAVACMAGSVAISLVSFVLAVKELV